MEQTVFETWPEPDRRLWRSLTDCLRSSMLDVASCVRLMANRKRSGMKRILCVSLMILLTPSAYAAALPGDSADGKRLIDANCMRCHDTSVYSRKDHKIRSLDALKKQLSSCSVAANKSFSAIETENIIKYLNDQFYHFN
jgi:hypothetical protein